MGDESVQSDDRMGWFARREVDNGGGRVTTGSMDEDSGVGFVRCGVFSNSASVPSSVSSRHRTPLFSPFPGDFFFGVNETPFFATVGLRRFGDARIGEPKFEVFANEGAMMGFSGDGPPKATCFFRLGVPERVGGKASVGMRLPSGLMM